MTKEPNMLFVIIYNKKAILHELRNSHEARGWNEGAVLPSAAILPTLTNLFESWHLVSCYYFSLNQKTDWSFLMLIKWC